MGRFARYRRVFFWEEPIFETIDTPNLEVSHRPGNVTVAVPHLPWGTSPEEAAPMQRRMLGRLFHNFSIDSPTFWYYSPMAIPITRDVLPARVIYDCMDELSAFRGAPRELLAYERELLERADLVFTGGQSLYEAKKNSHPSVHSFPSSIEFEHFSAARQSLPVPADEQSIPGPRIGFYGVIDERADLDLIRTVATLRPDWHFIMIGPVTKVDPDQLPQRENIHYLGMKSYAELPAHLAHWDLAMLPFALNQATEFISPTKTPEYLAAGRPVVSTPIRDVVHPYGDAALVHIARSATEFVEAAERAMRERADDPGWLARVDALLRRSSWEGTWSRMAQLEKATQPDFVTESASASRSA
jgi:UDP-galactopyranose mutase